MQQTVIKSSNATVQNGVARADGKFWVTESDIHFEPYNTEFGLGPYKLDRQSVSKVEKCVAMGGGFIPVTTDAIKITLSDDHSYKFILAFADEWLELLRP